VIRRATIALIATMLVGGCGDSSEPALAVAGVDEILGPYRTEPYRAYDPAMLEAFENECLGMLGGLDTQYELVLADGRGGGRLMLLYTGPDGGSAECFGRFDDTGQPTSDGGGTSSGGVEPPLDGLELRPGSSGGGTSENGEEWSYVHGSAGPGIRGVVIEVGDGARITASLAAGTFGAWWPGGQGPVRIQGFDDAGTLVADEPY
jgi:hypothetical protein